MWGGEIFENGEIIPFKRPRGRPPRNNPARRRTGRVAGSGGRSVEGWIARGRGGGRSSVLRVTGSSGGRPRVDTRTVECFRLAEGVLDGAVQAPSTSIAAAQDVLLATKLRAPQPRTGWVPRPRLVRRLQAGTERELVLVCGPAGFGKSSLLADWARGRPAAGGVAVARRGRQRPGAVLAPRRRRARRRHGPASPSGRRARSRGAGVDLVRGRRHGAGQRARRGARTRWLLVVDDYHVIEAPEVHRSLEFLLDHLPPALRLVLASRSDPPLPLARLRARGQLAELRARATCGSPRGESRRAAARGRSGTTCPTAVVAALASAPRAGPPGLQLAALSLQGRARRRPVRRGVLRQPPLRAGLPHRGGAGPAGRRSCGTFLLETSVLDRLSGPLCDAVRRAPRRPAAAGVGRAGEPVPDPARRGAPVVALPPPVRRSAARPAAARRPGPRAGAAPRGRGLVRASTACPTTPSATRWPPATPTRAARSSRSTSRSRSGGAPRAPPSPRGSPRCRPR